MPGPSPLQEQLFFVFLLLLMLICFFRAGYGDKTRRPSHAAPLSKRLPHRGLQEQGWRVRKQQEGPPAPRTLQRAATPLVVAVARLLVACLRHLRRRGARWTTAMARQTTRMATPCPTRATERRRRRRVFACQRRSSGSVRFSLRCVINNRRVRDSLACVVFRACHAARYRCFAVLRRFSAALLAAVFARPRARQAPHFLARGSLALGLSGFHGHACTRSARG